MRTILVTGAAGFIGYHVASRLLDDGDRVIGLDNINSYYDPSLKLSRLSELTGRDGFHFVKGDICDERLLHMLFAAHAPTVVIHLAAQAGVRYSLEKPFEYGTTNLMGVLTILEACRHHAVEHLLLASSSSVYGANTSVPFRASQNVDHPISLYAATKKSAELMAHSYAHLFRLPITALRFFTVYGPHGRPDMALFKFTHAIQQGRPIELFNGGRMTRDFTYVDDVVESIVRLAARPAEPDAGWSSDDPTPASSDAPYRVYNVGNSHPVELRYLISLLEQALGKRALIAELPMQPGDVSATWADASALAEATGYSPHTSIEEGVARYVRWYRGYYDRSRGEGTVPEVSPAVRRRRRTVRADSPTVAIAQRG